MAFAKAIPFIADKSGFNARRHQQAVEQALDKAALVVEADFQKSTATWEHKPVFNVTREPGKRTIFTTDPQYNWINRGTRIRYATMTPDFIAKTKPGVLASGTGRGGVLFVSRKHPRPGIEARSFDMLIVEEINATFAPLVQAEILRVIRNG